MDNEKVYKKIGRKYEPIGIFYDREWLTDGLWLVHSKGCGFTSIPYLAPFTKISDVPNLNIVEICATNDYINRICSAWYEYETIMKESGESKCGYGITNWDKAKIALQVVLKMNQEVENKK